MKQSALPGFEGGERGEIGTRYTHAGQQVLCDTKHYADCISSNAAERTALALNALDAQEDWAVLISRVK
jgi:hypothetical protein